MKDHFLGSCVCRFHEGRELYEVVHGANKGREPLS